jgi:hypothetical protein
LTAPPPPAARNPVHRERERERERESESERARERGINAIRGGAVGIRRGGCSENTFRVWKSSRRGGVRVSCSGRWVFVWVVVACLSSNRGGFVVATLRFVHLWIYGGGNGGTSSFLP